MTYIKKIVLENFQSHKFTEMEFSKEMNVIVGHSDSGKTSILRAIRWCLYNEPGGIEFLREGQKQVKVEIYFQDNTVVTRLRSNSKNQYILKHNDEEFVFEGFGTQVPQEIIDATGIRKTALDDKKTIPLNFSGQLEGPFLLNESDSFKASAIGRLVGVHIIDESMRETLRDKKQISNEISLNQKRREELDEKLEEYNYLDGLRQIRETLKAKQSTILNMSNRLNETRELYNTYNLNKKSIYESKNILKTLPELDVLESIIHKIKIINMERNNLFSLQSEYSFNKKEILESKIEIKNTKFVEKLYSLLEKIQFKSTQLTKLKPFKELKVSVQDEIKSTEDILFSFTTLKDVDLDRISKMIQEYSILNTLYTSLKENYSRRNLGNIYISKFNNLDFIENHPSTIENKLSHLKTVKESFYLYRENIKESKSIQEASKSMDIEFLKVKKEYLTTLEKVGRCPLCHQSIESHDLFHIRQFIEEEE